MREAARDVIAQQNPETGEGTGQQRQTLATEKKPRQNTACRQYYRHAPLSEQVFDIAQANGEAVIHEHRICDNSARKSAPALN